MIYGWGSEAMEKSRSDFERVILLVDMNAFFISCEMARNPELKGKPAAVAGDPERRSGIILAANYDARKFGVKTTMLLHEAQKLCPRLVLVPPDHRLYSQKSRKVMKILGRYTPVIEQNSIDEAWMDITGCDILFGNPAQTARSIMDTIMEELDLWCSIGISYNKFMAKMASEIKKPLGITEVWKEDIPSKIWTLPVREMYGIGKQTEKKLNSLAIFSIGDIASADPSLLRKNFGKYGEELHRLANGIDPSPVIPHTVHESKSISRSTTLPEDIVDLDKAKTILMELSEEVGAEARQYGFKGRTVSITVKYGDFRSITRQRTVSPTYLTKEIYEAGFKLLEDNWDCKRPVRLLGIGISNFDEGHGEQASFFDSVINDGISDTNKEEKLEKAMDTIRNRFGKDMIKRAKTME